MSPRELSRANVYVHRSEHTSEPAFFPVETGTNLLTDICRVRMLFYGLTCFFANGLLENSWWTDGLLRREGTYCPNCARRPMGSRNYSELFPFSRVKPFTWERNGKFTDLSRFTGQYFPRVGQVQSWEYLGITTVYMRCSFASFLVRFSFGNYFILFIITV